MGYFLVTAADERCWRLDCPVVFLGEWCRLYARRHVWQKMDAVLAAPYGLASEERAKDLRDVQNLAAQLQEELGTALNAFHATHHSPRYWHIVVGNWLQRYVAVAFNRYVTVERVLQQYPISGTAVLDGTGYSLATSDSDAFLWACNDDEWNQVFYGKIVASLTPEGVEIITVPRHGGASFTGGETVAAASARPRGTRQYVRDAASWILRRFVRDTDALIISSYLPPLEELKLHLSLGQAPQLWRSPAPRRFSLEPKMREQLVIEEKSQHGFERFLRRELPQAIPTCYVEGYHELVQLSQTLPWPREPRFIFTSSSFDTDEVFKVWAAGKADEGIPYFVGQHGNNYGTLLGSDRWPALVTCDRFFTWGWTNGSARNVPAFIFKTVGQKKKSCAPGGGLLLIELSVPHRIFPWDTHAEHELYQEEQFQFIAALPAPIREQVTVRLHGDHKKLTWDEPARWRDRSPRTPIETGRASIRDLIDRSRLVVYSYDSTGILESLALDVPTICFWRGGLAHLLPDARPYYELLRQAGIIADTPKQAAEWIASRWEHISEWWFNPNVRAARVEFQHQYARSERRPIRTMRKLLTEACRLHSAT